jgi:hypothetical protein
MTKQLKDAYGAETAAAGRLGDEAAKAAGRLAGRLGPQAARVKKLEAQVAKAANEVNRLQAMYKTNMNDLRPALVKKDDIGTLPGYEALQIPGMEDYAMPTFMAKEFNNAIRKHGLQGIHKQYRRIMAVWKKFSTVYWLGFHIRNNVGAVFNNILGGVGVGTYVNAHKVLHGGDKDLPPGFLKEHGLDWMSPEVAGDDLGIRTYDDLHNLAASTGIHGDNSQGVADIRSAIDEMNAIDNPKERAKALKRLAGGGKGPVGQVGKLGAILMRTSEDFHRTAAFLEGLKQSGGDVYGARQFTMLRHGDYLDLTDFEQGTMKSLLPFYKWMRTNTPYQIHNLMENPVKHLTALKLRDAAYTTQGLDPDEERAKQPEWMQAMFAIPMGKKSHDGAVRYMAMDLPMSDLYQGTNEYLSSFLPMIRPFVENTVGVATYTGAPLTGKKVPISWAPGPVGQLLDAVGMAEVGPDGQTYMTDKQENLLGMIPVYSRFRNWLSADPKRVKLRMNTLASAFLGFGIRDFGPDEIAAEERAFYFQEIEPAITQFQDMGGILPDKDQLDASVYTSLGFLPPATETAAEGVVPGSVVPAPAAS